MSTRSIFHNLFRWIVSFVLLGTWVFNSRSESINEIFIRLNIENVREFDKLSNPTLNDSISYINDVQNIIINYCDSCTSEYNRELFLRVSEAFPCLKQHISDDTKIEVLNATIRVLFNDELINKDINYQYAIFSFVFDIVSSTYHLLDDEDMQICWDILVYSYLVSKSEISTSWISDIRNVASPEQYIELSEILYPLCSYIASNGEGEIIKHVCYELEHKCTELFPIDSKIMIDGMAYLSKIYADCLDYENAYQLLLKVIEYNETHEVAYKDRMTSLRNMVILLRTCGKSAEAKLFAQKLVNSHVNQNTTEYLEDTERLAACVFYAGEESKAIEMLLENQAKIESICPEKLSTHYNNLSTFYRLVYDYARSLKFAEEAYACLPEKRDGYEEKFLEYAILINFGAAYSILNDIPSSLSALTKADKIRGELANLRNFDPERVEAQIIQLVCLTRNFTLCNQPDDAEKALFKALEFTKEFYGEDNVRHLKTYALLADIHLIRGDDDKAFEVYDNIIKRIDVNTHEYHTYLSEFSDYCMNRGLYERGYEVALEAYNKIHGIKDLIRLSRFEYQLYKYPILFAHLKEIYSRNRDLVNHSFLTLNNIQRKSFWWDSYVGQWFQEELPYMLINSCSSQPEAMRLLYDSTIFSKGIILSSDIAVRNIIYESSDSCLIDKYNQLQDLFNRNINDILVTGSNYFSDFGQLESEIMDYVRENCNSLSSLKATSLDIQAKLDSNSCAIEFISLPDSTDSKKYYALILEPDTLSSPQLTFLFNEKEINLIDPNEYFCNNKISDLVWKPIHKYLNKYKSIYFAPCQILHNIAIENLPDPNNDGFLSDNYNIYRLSNTREILKPAQEITNFKTALFGGMIYRTDTPITENMDFPAEQLRDSVAINRSNHSYLPYSRIEVIKVDSILRDFSIERDLYLGLNGSETNFRNLCLSHAPAILHIATHSICYTNEDIGDNPQYSELPFLKLSKHHNIYTEDLALTQSTLLFSGADNKSISETIQSENDGILTAEDISNFDLSNTELVILSACQTALGELKDDGVFGLQRGFKKAGVNSIIMSLWEVDDRATQIFMEKFYENLLKGHSKLESLHKAQFALRSMSKYNSPYYWAAFILLDGMN